MNDTSSTLIKSWSRFRVNKVEVMLELNKEIKWVGETITFK